MAEKELSEPLKEIALTLVAIQEKEELLRVQICDRLGKDPRLFTWAQIGRLLARETPEGKRMFPKRGRPRKSDSQKLENLRAKILEHVDKDSPGLTVAEWTKKIKEHVKGDPERENLFLAYDKTIEQSVSRGRRKLRKMRNI